MGGYPIELDLHAKMVLVVGFGMVGRRKAQGLIAAGARVVAVDPNGQRIDAVNGVELLAEPYRTGHLEGAKLVFAAATPEVNRQVVTDAHQAGIWVGSATDPEMGDFTIPAVWRKERLIATVSTSGASPALAAALRDTVAEALGTAAAELVGLFAELRPLVLARLTDPEIRQQFLANWADPLWLELCRAEGPQAVRRQIVDALARGGTFDNAAGLGPDLDLPGH
jgi:siroheme synthase-like protein